MNTARRTAFTLVELLVVIAIIGTLFLCVSSGQLDCQKEHEDSQKRRVERNDA